MLVVVAAVAIGVASPAHAATGVRDTPGRSWNTNGTVFATQLSEDGNTLYIGGTFTRVRENPPDVPGASVAVSNVAAIDVDTGVAISTWTPQVTDENQAVVHSLAVKDDRVFIGGNFAAVGGEPRQNLAAVDAVDGEPTDGLVDPFAPQVTKTTGTLPPDVYTILPGDSKLYIGGLFSHVDGKGRANLAAFDLATDELDPSWTPKTSGGPPKVRDLKFASDRATIFAAGRFNNVTGSDGTLERRESVARLETDTGNLNPWKIPDGVIGAPQVGWDLVVTPTRLYGGFGAGPNFAAAFSLDTGDVGTQVWRFKTVGNVQTVELSSDGTRLFLGGHFGTNRLEQRVCGDQHISGLASVDPATGAINCDWIPQLEPSFENGNGARAFATTDTHLWVGGGFTHVSGVEQSNLARFRYDPTPPRVVRVAPAKGATGVLRGINVRATLSERVYKVKANFKLYRKGSSTPVPAVVSPVEGTNNRRWALNPKRSLRAGTTYIAKILTGVEDGAGNTLDQNHSKTGDQLMRWSFKTRS